MSPEWTDNSNLGQGMRTEWVESESSVRATVIAENVNFIATATCYRSITSVSDVTYEEPRVTWPSIGSVSTEQAAEVARVLAEAARIAREDLPIKVAKIIAQHKGALKSAQAVARLYDKQFSPELAD